MTESKFTKGPWTAKNAGAHWNNKAIDNWVICYGSDGEQIVDHVYEEADAYLIAAAPELYEALKEARDCVAECANYESSDKRRPDRMQSTLRILEMVDKAIGKAGGRS